LTWARILPPLSILPTRPIALRVAIEALRKMTDQRVIAVFGSAGLRDREKRGMMAEVATRLADVSIFTAEDPRTESLDDILAEMAEAARREGGKEGLHSTAYPTVELPYNLPWIWPNQATWWLPLARDMSSPCALARLSTRGTTGLQ